MEKRERKEIIPEKILNVIEYVAFDGRAFRNEHECIKYEENLKRKQLLQSHPVYQSRRDLSMYPDEEFTRMYYLRSKEDYDFLVDEIM